MKAEPVEQAKSTSESLIGLWAVVGDENVTFDIRPDSLYYPEQFKSYKYQIKGDSVRIYYDDFNESFAVKFNGADKLTLTGEDGPQVYRRVKE